jgi:predicted dehydrogenase
MDGGIEIVAGAFSQDPKKSRQTGQELGLAPERVYDNYKQMIKAESKLPKGQAIDFVCIVTPNNTHFEIAKGFLEAGFDVVCDKPMTTNVEEAKKLVQIVRKTKRLFALTHNYSAFPMVKLARDLIKQGELGRIQKVNVRYIQGWLSVPLEKTGQKQAEWRVDPKRSGAAGTIGDIGTHAANLAEHITGLQISEVCADLTSFGKGRKLDDDGACLIHYNNGANGVLYASQISTGEENGLAISVFGEKKGLIWYEENPNYLFVQETEGPMQRWSRGNNYVAKVCPQAARGTRLPAGHQEGFIEAFANIYCNFSDTLRARLNGKKPDKLALDFPTVEDGLRGMQFLDAVLKSNKTKKWIKVKK